MTRRIPKFFALLWRINAIIIAVVGLIAAVVLGMAGYLVFKDITRARQVSNVANIALDTVGETKAQLGTFEAVMGTSVLRASLNVRQSYPLGSVSKEAHSTRNYLYFDPSTRTTYWLRSNMNGVILYSMMFPNSVHEKENALIAVHVIVEKDSNHDERLSEQDNKQIAISMPNGKNYRILVPKVEEIHAVTLLPSGRLLIIYALGKKLTAVEVNTQDLSSEVVTYPLSATFKG